MTGVVVEIRRAVSADFPTVGELTVDAYVADGFLTRDDDYVQVLVDAADRARTAELWVAVADEVIVGTVTFCPPGSLYRELAGDGEGEFRMLAVHPTARGRGIARALVAHCFDRCRDLGLGELVLCSMTEMRSAHGLYTSMGFVRDPELDFQPVPNVLLLAFRCPVG